jgi:hypothetical protein
MYIPVFLRESFFGRVTLDVKRITGPPVAFTIASRLRNSVILRLSYLDLAIAKPPYNRLSCPNNISHKTIKQKDIEYRFSPRCFPNRLRANTTSGVWQKEATTDRSSFEANTGLTFKEATSSIDD